MDTILASLGSSLAGNVIDLGNVATTFGGGAIASEISGNPVYSQDPSAASYAVAKSQVANSSNIILILAVIFIGYKLLK